MKRLTPALRNDGRTSEKKNATSFLPILGFILIVGILWTDIEKRRVVSRMYWCLCAERFELVKVSKGTDIMKAQRKGKGCSESLVEARKA